MKMMERHASVFHMADGRKKTIFMPSALSHGDVTWKAFANIARREKENLFSKRDKYTRHKYTRHKYTRHKYTRHKCTRHKYTRHSTQGTSTQGTVHMSQVHKAQ